MWESNGIERVEVSFREKRNAKMFISFNLKRHIHFHSFSNIAHWLLTAVFFVLEFFSNNFGNNNSHTNSREEDIVVNECKWDNSEGKHGGGAERKMEPARNIDGGGIGTNKNEEKVKLRMDGWMDEWANCWRGNGTRRGITAMVDKPFAGSG